MSHPSATREWVELFSPSTACHQSMSVLNGKDSAVNAVCLLDAALLRLHPYTRSMQNWGAVQEAPHHRESLLSRQERSFHRIEPDHLLTSKVKICKTPV